MAGAVKCHFEKVIRQFIVFLRQRYGSKKSLRDSDMAVYRHCETVLKQYNIFVR